MLTEGKSIAFNIGFHICNHEHGIMAINLRISLSRLFSYILKFHFQLYFSCSISHFVSTYIYKLYRVISPWWYEYHCNLFKRLKRIDVFYLILDTFSEHSLLNEQIFSFRRFVLCEILGIHWIYPAPISDFVSHFQCVVQQ